MNSEKKIFGSPANTPPYKNESPQLNEGIEIQYWYDDPWQPKDYHVVFYFDPKKCHMGLTPNGQRYNRIERFLRD